LKAIAFYLPQFHAIPENDEWWGKGFTEWTNVRAGSPNFDGLSAACSLCAWYYDLRDPSVLQKQAELAASYGIYRLLLSLLIGLAADSPTDLPLQQSLTTPDLSFPFCICWANKKLDAALDGKEQEDPDSQITLLKTIWLSSARLNRSCSIRIIFAW